MRKKKKIYNKYNALLNKWMVSENNYYKTFAIRSALYRFANWLDKKDAEYAQLSTEDKLLRAIEAVSGRQSNKTAVSK